MHKPAAEEEITSLHDLSATDLIAGYRAKQFSPSEVLEEVIEHVAAWEPHIKALYLFDPDSARAAARPPRSSQLIMPPGSAIWRRARACCG